ncbi:DNA polymerase III subunit delta' [Pueribacillus sp. YX66]|uniref:DNA polymerase III subunit delta' n=1 Tax=Pueribacillus sp. YX66 TaxID=3229242 RepID=UPI00358D8D19
MKISWTDLKKKQSYAVTLLVNSLKKDRLSHAYIFEGSKGTGKVAVAKTLAKTLFCSQLDGAEPCHECRDCRRIDSNNHPDVRIFSPESGKSITIEQIEQLLKEFSYRGSESKRRLFVIEHANRMTQVAANRLLKFIEEPAEQETVILITEQLQQMLPTIVSRCQTVSFKPLLSSELTHKLEENAVSKSLAKLASALTDDYETAYEMAEDELFAQARKLVIQLMEEVLDRPSQVFLTIHEKWSPLFKDREQMELGLDLFLLWFRDVISLHLKKDEQVIFAQERELLGRYQLRYTVQQVARQMEIVLEAKKHLNANVNPQLVIEHAVLKLQEG